MSETKDNGIAKNLTAFAAKIGAIIAIISGLTFLINWATPTVSKTYRLYQHADSLEIMYKKIIENTNELDNYEALHDEIHYLRDHYMKENKKLKKQIRSLDSAIHVLERGKFPYGWSCTWCEETETE